MTPHSGCFLSPPYTPPKPSPRLLHPGHSQPHTVHTKQEVLSCFTSGESRPQGVTTHPPRRIATQLHHCGGASCTCCGALHTNSHVYPAPLQRRNASCMEPSPSVWHRHPAPSPAPHAHAWSSCKPSCQQPPAMCRVKDPAAATPPEHRQRTADVPLATQADPHHRGGDAAGGGPPRRCGRGHL